MVLSPSEALAENLEVESGVYRHIFDVLCFKIHFGQPAVWCAVGKRPGVALLLFSGAPVCVYANRAVIAVTWVTFTV